MSKWYEFYNYDHNKDLIIKLCKKFKLNEPIERANYYGGTDITIQQGLKLYTIQIDEFNETVVIRRRTVLDRGKNCKEYSNPVKKLHNGNIWYEAIKFISKDNEI